ncbi:MAG: 3-hydroxyacyl-CoA dehydrogenase NAD-binding domain-containing protein [Vicinamibacterales bacterium]
MPKTFGLPVRSAAVLGAGTMGAQIAAHLANAGIPVLLLDVTTDAARDGLKRASALRPDPFFTRQTAALITTGSLVDDLGRIATVDWVIEAVVERLDIKRDLFARVDAARGPLTIVSSNTSGIPIAAIAQGRSLEFRRHFLGTHFFNPPRYLRLVEVIPTPDTDPAAVERISTFCDYRLGKGVVLAQDAPGFIANRIGIFGLIRILEALATGAYTIEEIDAITGPPLGRPKSATFRTMDIAGLDILGHVIGDLATRLSHDGAGSFALPPLVQALIDTGAIGEKAGRGFYKREGTDILTLDPASLSYRAKQSPRLAALDNVKGVDDVRTRVKTLFGGQDKVGNFLRATLTPTLLYAAEVSADVATSIDHIDQAMRWGFGWEIGPFELWDAIGVRDVLAAAGGAPVPALAKRVLDAGRNQIRESAVVPGPGLQILKSARDRQKIVRSNAGASLVDLGDDVLAVEFHSKMNAIGGDTIAMLQAGVKEAAANFRALVVGTEAPDFSAGANLMLVLLEAQDGNWDEIDLMVRTFQQTSLALRYSPVPVVVAPGGLALGGGCEVVLHGDRVQAAAETYMGLVEVGVGLIPAGGGTKEMLARAMRLAGPGAHPLAPSQSVFETIALAKASTSAANARQIGYLRDSDSVTMNRDRVLADAKMVALDRAATGYTVPTSQPIPVGGESVEAALCLGVHLLWRGARISDHDALIGRTLAHVIAGGALPHATTVSEQQLLDLEREAFLKLCGERRTLERIQHTLTTGKPLRN